MEEKAERSVRSPAWMRALRISIGAVSIALSLVAIVYPGLAVETAVLVISVILPIVGIEQILLEECFSIGTNVQPMQQSGYLLSSLLWLLQ
jgi:uncharacterized membrane protein HdeD (DUF308 family)